VIKNSVKMDIIGGHCQKWKLPYGLWLLIVNHFCYFYFVLFLDFLDFVGKSEYCGKNLMNWV
jgi:hypothetical protein